MIKNKRLSDLKLIAGKSVWLADKVMSAPNFYFRLNDEDVADLLQALSHFKRKNLNAFNINQENFKLHGLKESIAKITEELTHGLGVSVIQHFPLDNLSPEDLSLLYLGLGCHIGTLLPQDNEKNKLFVITDKSMVLGQSHHNRQSITNHSLAFHSDSCDITSLLCINPAKKGGETRLANTLAIHNAILQQHPEQLLTLYNEFYFAHPDWYSKEQGKFCKLPIFAYYQNRHICLARRNRIEAAQKMMDVPRLTKAQILALDTLDRQFENDKFTFSIQLQRGEILLFNNLMTCHARTAFDDEDASLKRCLLRLWISPQQSCELPQEFSTIFHSTKAGAVRGGYL